MNNILLSTNFPAWHSATEQASGHLTKHEGKKGFGDYKETHTRRIITTWTDSTFSWKNPDGERMDGKAYEIYEQYKREK